MSKQGLFITTYQGITTTLSKHLHTVSKGKKQWPVPLRALPQAKVLVKEALCGSIPELGYPMASTMGNNRAASDQEQQRELSPLGCVPLTPGGPQSTHRTKVDKHLFMLGQDQCLHQYCM